MKVVKWGQKSPGPGSQGSEGWSWLHPEPLPLLGLELSPVKKELAQKTPKDRSLPAPTLKCWS